MFILIHCDTVEKTHHSVPFCLKNLCLWSQHFHAPKMITVLHIFVECIVAVKNLLSMLFSKLLTTLQTTMTQVAVQTWAFCRNNFACWWEIMQPVFPCMSATVRSPKCWLSHSSSGLWLNIRILIITMVYWQDIKIWIISMKHLVCWLDVDIRNLARLRIKWHHTVTFRSH